MTEKQEILENTADLFIMQISISIFPLLLTSKEYT